MRRPMRIAIVDDILEQHVASSLAAALRRRGHLVLATGKHSHGPGPTRDAGEQAMLAGALRAVQRFAPDVALLMRPQSWPVEFSTLLRRDGVRIAAWLSDDPVLFASGYRHAIESVDLLLHCGGAPVIEHYDRLGLAAPGVNFPFWTATRARRDPERPTTHRGVFLGHLRGAVRSHRLGLLESLDPMPAIYGQLDRGASSAAWLGELRTTAEIDRALADAAVGLSLPQQFADYAGTELDFEGLAALGGFETPSRVVQYAAMGLGVLTLDPAGASDAPSAFQGQVVTRTPEAFRERYRSLDRESLRALAEAATAEFGAHFSADRRAAMLEAILMDDSWRTERAEQRAVLYRDFSGLGRERRRRRTRTVPRRSRERRLRSVALLGTGWQDPDSHLSAVRRSLTDEGFRVHDLNPYALRDRLVSDPSGDFSSLLDSVSHDPVLGNDAMVLVGTEIGMTPAMWTAIEASGLVVGVAYDDAGWRAPRRSRLSARADVATTVRREVAEALARLDVDGRSRASVGMVAVEAQLRAAQPVMAVTDGAAELHGVAALDPDMPEPRDGEVLRRAVLDPALAAAPSSTMRTLRRLRRHGVALLLPVEVLREVVVEPAAGDASFATPEELLRKLRALADPDEGAATPTTMAGGDPRDRAHAADLAALLAAID